MFERVVKNKPDWYFLVLIAALVFEYLRIHDFFLPFLSPLKIPGILMLLLLFVFIDNKKAYIFKEKTFVLFGLFWLVCIFSITYATNHHATYKNSMTLVWMFTGFIFPMYVILDNKEKLFRFFDIWIVIHFILALTVIYNGGRGPGGIMYDENDACMALVMGFPFAFYRYFFTDTTFLKKLFYIITMLSILVGIAVTASRGGVVGLIATLLVMIALSDKPISNYTKLFFLILIFGGIFLSQFSEEYLADMSSATDPEDSTRDERFYSWSIGWQMFLANPIWGVGAGNYPWTNHLYAHLSPMWEDGRQFLGGRLSHSVYFTVIPELGLVGTIVYFSIIKSGFNRCRSIKKYLKLKRDNQSINIKLLVNAFLASLVGFLSSGAFISVLYYPFFWYLIAFMVITHRLVMNDSDNITENQTDLN